VARWPAAPARARRLLAGGGDELGARSRPGRKRAPACDRCTLRFHAVVEGLLLDLSGLEGYPIAIGHGSFDEIIPVQFGREAMQRVEAAGAELLYREYPLPHTIDPRFLPELRELVRRATAGG